MAKLNTRTTQVQTYSPITSERTPSGTTFEGGPGFARDARSELFLYAVSRFSGESSFYEDAQKGDLRYTQLVATVAELHPFWLAAFLRWLRTEANMRTAAIVGAAVYAHTVRAIRKTRPDFPAPTVRSVVDSVILRADEPGEMVAYWMTNYGKTFSGGLQRGVADAMLRVGNEYNYLKYGEAGGYTWDRLLNLAHPGEHRRSRQKIRGEWQHQLFGHIIKRRYEPATAIPDGLQTLTRRQALMKMPVDERRAALEPVRLAEAGMTWEALAGWLQGPMDRQAWEAIIPNMGYMALIRNLRNFDQAGVSDQVAQKVAAKISNPEEVAKSRQLPMRFLSAYRNAPSDRWKWPLDQAVNLALRNIPQIKGHTLILVDTSGSMRSPMSDKSGLMRWDAAALFGCAMASRCEKVDLVSFSSSQTYYHDPRGTRTKVFPLRPGESLLASVARWERDGFFLNGGTETELSLRQHFIRHDRVVILTDEQAWGGSAEVGSTIPNTPIYTWNLAGYQRGHAPSGSYNRHTFGGLSDQGFKMIPMLESVGANGRWPWEVTQTV